MSLFSKIFGTKDNPIKPPISTEENRQQPASLPADFDPSNIDPGFMAIDDIFGIKGRGSLVVGRIESGTFYVGQTVTISTSTGQIQTIILDIKSFGKTYSHVSAGKNVGLLLKNVESNLLEPNNTVRGM